MSATEVRIDPACRAVIFDMDGVITDTSQLHARAWKEAFDAFLQSHGTGPEAEREFDLVEDYHAYVDGRTRVEGIRCFLASRNIVLPEGDEGDTGLDTVSGLGKHKNALYLDRLREEGVRVFDDALSLLRRLRKTDLKIGLATSSRNASIILDRTGLGGYFDYVADGNTVIRHELRSKPAPDAFLHVAEHLSVPFGECVIIEDSHEAAAGVINENPGQVIGVERHAHTGQSSRFRGCHVVSDLSFLAVGAAEGGPGDERIDAGNSEQ